MELREILTHCDHTLLKQTATWEEIKAVCDEGLKYNCASVCIPPCYVKRANEYLGERLKVCTVIGFPNGYATPAVKVFEAENAVRHGADEIDMVINIGWVKDRRWDRLLEEIKAVKAGCRGRILKVIIEACLLTQEEKVKMCEIVTMAGADYIKTSTGFSTAGATREDVALFKAHVGPNVKIKAAGGIRTLQDARDLLELGADRLGASALVKLAGEQAPLPEEGGSPAAGPQDSDSPTAPPQDSGCPTEPPIQDGGTTKKPVSWQGAMFMWAENSVFYQIYPLGFCGAPAENDGALTHRLPKVAQWAGHIQKLGADAVYLGPVFESDRHGYDTRDYRVVDCRLGDNGDLKELVRTFHDHGIKVILDGVFNHVGRGFWAFRDVQEKRWDSPYKDWFHINFDGNSNYNDGFWYEGWEGHFELVKLNLRNGVVVDYLLDTVRFWAEEFDIDGLRLDVAYSLEPEFLRRLRQFCNGLKPEFFLVGETLHGDYNRWVGEELLHSCTNYECYKGLWSALNSMNLFEIVHSLKRQFGPEQWTLYRGKHLMCFGDNHDVTRAASVLRNENHLPLLYGMLFGMPGIPCVYYGSEWGAKADKSQGDAALRPSFEKPEWNALTGQIAAMAKAHRESEALCWGDFKDLVLTNKQTVFQRQSEHERVLVAVNADSEPYVAHFDAGCGRAVDLLTGKEHDFGGGSELPPYSVFFWQCE